MNILFLGSLISANRYRECIQYNVEVDNAALTLQTLLIKGLQENNCKLSTMSVPNIRSYKGNNLVETEYYQNNFSNNNVSLFYSKMLRLKQLITPLIFKRYLTKDFFNAYTDVILIYAVQSHWLKIAEKLKKENPHIKVLLVIPDLPHFMSENNSMIYKTLKKFEAQLVLKYIGVVDGFIVLTKYMSDYFPKNKPYIVVEGICRDIESDLKLESKDLKYKTILYTGTLAKRYGILNLVDAFKKTVNPNYRLIICGKGDTSDSILSSTNEDQRIIYKGLQPHDKIIELQQTASLLVNPRGPEGEYTKYSFPSKTMEYFASGIPVLLCKLPGIPNEYYNYCFTVENNDVETLNKKIEEILNMSSITLSKIGIKAKDFIYNTKNTKVQGKRIVDFINKI